MERKFLEHSLLRSESSTGAKVPWNESSWTFHSPGANVPRNESSTGAKVLSMVFSLPGTKVQRNEKASYQLASRLSAYADKLLRKMGWLIIRSSLKTGPAVARKDWRSCHCALRTLRPQDTSAPIFVAEVSRTLVPKCLKTFREGAAGQQQANRTRHQTCPCGPICPGLCPAASPHYANCAACVGRRHKRYYCRWSSRWCCRDWTMATRCSPVYLATSSTDYSL